MKEIFHPDINQANSATCIFSCISRCEKGIYEAYKIEMRRGINYQMPAFDSNIIQYIGCDNKKIQRGSL